MEKIPVQEVDRMINEGLGAGFIIYEYDLEKYKPLRPINQEEKERSEIQ
jgi:hypothetical protein